MIHFAYAALSLIIGFVSVVGVPGALIGMLVAPTIVTPIVTTIVQRFVSCKICIFIVALIVGSVVSYWIGREGQYDRGKNDAIAAIARNDKDLVDKTYAAREKVKACQARNLTWVQSTGECR